MLAAVNLLTIPYYSGLNAMWNASGWIKFQFRDIATFILAAGCGTFTVLYLYTVYFTKLETKNNRFSKNSNYILSALMMFIGDYLNTYFLYLINKMKTFLKKYMQWPGKYHMGGFTSYGAIAKYLGTARSARMVGLGHERCPRIGDIPAIG